MSSDSSIQTLFNKQLFHVLEKIFMSVHPPTLDSCKLVNKEWNHYLKQHFWSKPRIRRHLMERKRQLIDGNRQSSTYIRTDFRLEVPHHHRFRRGFQIKSLAATRDWITAGLGDGRVVVIDLITHEQKVFYPPDGYDRARVALNDRTGIVILSPNMFEDIYIVHYEDWVQKQTFKVFPRIKPNSMNWCVSRETEPVLTKKHFIYNRNSYEIMVFTKQSGEYKHTRYIETGRDFLRFDANDYVIVTITFLTPNAPPEIWSTENGQLLKILDLEIDVDFAIRALCLNGNKVGFLTTEWGENVRSGYGVRVVDWMTEKKLIVWQGAAEQWSISHQICMNMNGDVFIPRKERNDVGTYRHVMGIPKQNDVFSHACAPHTRPAWSMNPSQKLMFTMTDMGTIVCLTEKHGTVAVQKYWL